MEEQELSMVVMPEEGGELSEYYSNSVRVVTSIYDVSVLFGRGRPVGLAGTAATMEAVCLVHMSPSQAKSVFLLLRQQLRSYEEQWGRIPVPPEMEEKFGGELDG